MADSAAATAPLAGLPPNHPAQVVGGLPVRDFIPLLQSASDHPAEPAAQMIFTAFYHRYGPWLLRVAFSRFGLGRDPSAAQEVVNDTLLAFFQQSRRFDLSRTPDNDLAERNLRAYLIQLARWQANQTRPFHASVGAHAADEKVIDFHPAPPIADGEAPPEDRSAATQRQRVEDWIHSLSNRDADVLRTYYLDDHAGRESDRLPSGTAEALAAKYGVTPSNLRHLKAKLLRQLREHLAQPSS